MKEAENTYKSAIVDKENGFYNWCCFKCQQAAEFALKAILYGFGLTPFGHSLTKLLRILENQNVDISSISIACKVLDLHYIPSRHVNAHSSGSPHEYHDEQIADLALKNAKKIIIFIKKINKINDKVKESYNRIKHFTENLIETLNPKCIILYGSFARGDFNERSDIDIIVIAKNLPENYFERTKLLYEQIKTPVPIEPLGYTPSEFIKMIYKRRCTSLFAMSEGIPLHGKKYFFSLKRIHDKIMKKYNIIKSESAWIPKL